MKTAKMTLQLILALTLPLNAMAVSNVRAPASEMELDTKVEMMTLKVQRDQLQKNIAEAAMGLQVLEDLAEPSLISSFRAYDAEVAQTLMLGGGGGFAISVAMRGAKAISLKTLNGMSVAATAIAAAGMVESMYIVLRETLSEVTYRKMHQELAFTSADVQMKYYIHYHEVLENDSYKLTVVEEKIKALTK